MGEYPSHLMARFRLTMSLRTMGDEMIPDEIKIEDLPMDYDSIVSKQAWEPVPTPEPAWNTVWELNHDELRDSTLSSLSLVYAPIPPLASGTSNFEKGKLKALLKVFTIGLPLSLD